MLVAKVCIAVTMTAIYLIMSNFLPCHTECYCIVGIRLELNGTSIKNDSYMSITDIGEKNKALLCHTNKTDCCTSSQIKAGEWYFSNENQVQKLLLARRNASHYFYRDRGSQVVRLNRVMNPPERGRFFCEVPDSSGKNQTIYVNIGKCKNWIHLRILNLYFHIQHSLLQ